MRESCLRWPWKNIYTFFIYFPFPVYLDSKDKILFHKKNISYSELRFHRNPHKIYLFVVAFFFF